MGEYSYEYSYEEKDVEKVGGGAGGLGLKMKKGQKMSQKQLQMLEMAAEERKTSTNPLCKEKKQTNMFRSRQITVVVNKCGLGHDQVNCKQKQPVPKEKIIK